RQPTLLVAVYRAPTASAAEWGSLLARALLPAIRSGQPVVLCGDFNARHTDWDHEETPPGRLVADFLTTSELVCLNGLFCHGQATFRNSDSVLDLFATSSALPVVSLRVLPDDSGLLSDHSPVLCCLGAPAPISASPIRHPAWQIARAD